jgi:hypothetical protein
MRLRATAREIKAGKIAFNVRTLVSAHLVPGHLLAFPLSHDVY